MLLWWPDYRIKLWQEVLSTFSRKLGFQRTSWSTMFSMFSFHRDARAAHYHRYEIGIEWDVRNYMSGREDLALSTRSYQAKEQKLACFSVLKAWRFRARLKNVTFTFVSTRWWSGLSKVVSTVKPLISDSPVISFLLFVKASVSVKRRAHWEACGRTMRSSENTSHLKPSINTVRISSLPIIRSMTLEATRTRASPTLKWSNTVLTISSLWFVVLQAG